MDQIVCRSFSEKNGYEIKENKNLIDYSSEEPIKDDSNDGCRTIAALKKICNFDNAMKTRYPYIANPENINVGRNVNDLANHKWFGEIRVRECRGMIIQYSYCQVY